MTDAVKTTDMPDQLIIFDGVCNLCNTVVQFVITRDPQARFHFTPLQSAPGQHILTQHHLPLDDFDSFIYLRQAKLHQRSTAALYLLKDLGGLWSLAYGFMIVPRFIRDWVYDRVARSRYSLWGKKDTCMIPTPDIKKRFL